MIDAVLRAAGYRNAATGSNPYHAVSLERLAVRPPSALVLGFFDAEGVAGQRWGVGRSPIVRRLLRERAVASLSASELGCPAWFAGDAVAVLSQARVRP